MVDGEEVFDLCLLLSKTLNSLIYLGENLSTVVDPN